MTAPAKISIASQIAAADEAVRRLRAHALGERQAVRELRIRHTEAVVATLLWLQEHQDEIRAFLALPEDVRAVIVSHGAIVAELAVELAKREAVARAGGPRR